MYATLDTAVIKPLRILQSVLCKYLNCGAFVRGVFIMRGFCPEVLLSGILSGGALVPGFLSRGAFVRQPLFYMFLKHLIESIDKRFKQN